MAGPEQLNPRGNEFDLEKPEDFCGYLTDTLQIAERLKSSYDRQTEEQLHARLVALQHQSFMAPHYPVRLQVELQESAYAESSPGEYQPLEEVRRFTFTDVRDITIDRTRERPPYHEDQVKTEFYDAAGTHLWFTVWGTDITISPVYPEQP